MINKDVRDVLTKKYYDEQGGLVFVSSSNKAENRWVSVRKRTTLSEIRRVAPKNLPFRKTKEEAQLDLDAYAARKRWDLEV